MHETKTSLIFYMWQVKMSLEQKNFFRLSRAVAAAAVNKILCHAYSLDGKT